MRHYKEHLIQTGTPIKEALKVLDRLAKDAITFVVDKDGTLLGSLTDGDVRRGLIKDISIEQPVDDIIQSEPKYIRKSNYDLKRIIEYREHNFRILPILDKDDQIINVINFDHLKSYLPVDVVIMAGGKGTRLRPLTNDTPKPLLEIGGEPILEHNLHRLSQYGMDDFWITVNYLGDQIENHFGNGNARNLKIEYVWEDKPLGTAGSLSKIDNFRHDTVLLTNSDLLTDLDYENFFLKFIEEDADLAVVTIPYKVDIPYAVLETSNGHVMNFKEKPTYTYYSNGGIYLMKREVVDYIPRGDFFDITDLMEELIADGKKVFSYPHSGYWLDVGKHEDFEKAQEDIKHLNIQ
jgi:dTDP-glucose pyrophosphorylase